MFLDEICVFFCSIKYRLKNERTELNAGSFVVITSCSAMYNLTRLCARTLTEPFNVRVVINRHQLRIFMMI